MSKAKAYLKENLVLVIAFVIVSAIEIAVIFPLMTGDHLSYDSSYQYGLTQHSLSEIWELLPYDYSPPFYAIALKLYSAVFGSSLLAMRTFSLFAIVGIYFISVFPMNTLFGKRSALICLLITFTTKNIFMAVHEIRPINFAFFFFEAAAVYAGIVLSKGTRYSYICLTVFSVLAMYTHNVAMVGVFSVYVVLLLFMLITKNWKKLRNVFISGCICGVLYLPWLGVILSQISNVQTHYWTSVCYFSDVLDWIFSNYRSSYLTSPLTDVIHLVVAVSLVAALCSHIDFKKLKGAKTFRGLLRLPAERSVYTSILFLALCLAFSVGVMELVAEFMHNIRSERYYYILTMLWIVILSAILGRLTNKACCTTFAVLMLTNHILNVQYMKETLDTANMPEIVQEVKERSPDNDIAFVHFHEFSLGLMCYYFPEATHYVCDETFTVLGTYDVFPCNVVDIGSIDNIWDYTDSFYMFKNRWRYSDWDYCLVDELERMNDSEIRDIETYTVAYEIFSEDFDFAEAVYTGEKNN